MTGKPREKLHVINLRCPLCQEYHYNTRNQVIITTLRPNDPLEDRIVRSLSTAGLPYGYNLAPTFAERLRLLNTSRYARNNNEQLEDNGMEALELDTPSDTSSETVTEPEGLPSIESLPSYLLDPN